MTFLADLARPPVALAGVGRPRARGAPLRRARGWRSRSRSPAPARSRSSAIGIAGLSLIPRYLTLPAVALCVLAGYAVLGFTTLEAGPARDALAARLAIGALAVGVAFLAVKASSFGRLYDELRFIDRTHDELAGLLAEPRVRAGMRCGALTFPTYRLVPDARWQLDAGAGARPHARRGPRRGRRRRLHHGRREVRAALRPRRRRRAARRTACRAAGRRCVHGPFAAYDVRARERASLAGDAGRALAAPLVLGDVLCDRAASRSC